MCVWVYVCDMYEVREEATRGTSLGLVIELGLSGVAASTPLLSHFVSPQIILQYRLSLFASKL